MEVKTEQSMSMILARVNEFANSQMYLFTYCIDW